MDLKLCDSSPEYNISKSDSESENWTWTIGTPTYDKINEKMSLTDIIARTGTEVQNDKYNDEFDEEQ